MAVVAAIPSTLLATGTSGAFVVLGQVVVWLIRRGKDRQAAGITQGKHEIDSRGDNTDYWRAEAIGMREEAAAHKARLAELTAKIAEQQREARELQAELWLLQVENRKLVAQAAARRETDGGRA